AQALVSSFFLAPASQYRSRQQRPLPVLSLASLPRLPIRACASARGPCQLGEAEHASDAAGRDVPRAVPQALAGPPQPGSRDVDFDRRDRFDPPAVASGTRGTAEGRFSFAGTAT